ncbi:MAG: helix-turn-helix domain-containing protein [Thermoanaerobaculia bacterium]
MNPSPKAEQQLARLRRELRERIRDAGKSLREVETQLGMGTDYLSQLLRGSMDIKAKHVLALLELLEVDPGEFFLALYPAVAPQPRLDEEFIAVRQDVSIAVIQNIVRTLLERGFISAEEAQRLLEPFETQEPKR